MISEKQYLKLIENNIICLDAQAEVLKLQSKRMDYMAKRIEKLEKKFEKMRRFHALQN